MSVFPCRSSAAAVLACAAGLTSCGGPPPARPEVTLPAPAPPTSARDTVAGEAPLTIAAVDAPPAVVIDGDLAEWRLPRGPGRRIVFAVTGEGAFVAGALEGGASARGVWFGMGSTVVTPGWNDRLCSGKDPDSPECHRETAARDAFEKAYAAAFERVFHIDANGVHAERDGTLVPSALVAWRASDRGATFEALIPKASLPRLLSAPLEALDLFADVARDAPPDARARSWTTVHLPTPVSFEPGGELRAKVLEAWRLRPCEDFLSYAPGDADRLIGAYSGPAPLYTREASLGEVEVGFAFRHPFACRALGEDAPPYERTLVVVSHRGRVREVRDLGRVVGVIPRDGALHVLDFSHHVDEIGHGRAEWGALSVAPDSTIKAGLAKPPARHVYPDTTPSLWTEFHAPDLRSFGVHGVALDLDPVTGERRERGLDIEWRWDTASASYVARERAVRVDRRP